MRYHLELQNSNLICIILAAGVEEFNMLALAYRAVKDTKICNYTAEWIEYRVEDKSLKRCIFVTLWRRNTVDNSLKNLIYALAGLT